MNSIPMEHHNSFHSHRDGDLEPQLRAWLQEDIGRGDWTTIGLGEYARQPGQAIWVAKSPGVIAGLPLAPRSFNC
jgi:nicotinate-nucleotide pyrophosphorylase (carboxylating)